MGGKSIRRSFLIGVGVCVLWALATSGFAVTLHTIKVAGSSTVLPIVTLAAEAFMHRHPEIRITVNAGGSGVGVQGVGTGRIDIGMTSRVMSPEEMRRYRQTGLTVHVVGRDAVACVVSSEIYDSGVRVLTREQIRDIYLGRIINWKQVGGPDRPIVVIDKERHRGTRHVFMQFVFNDPAARTPGSRLVTGSNNEEQAKIAQSNAAIGMLSLGWINRDVVGLDIRVEDRVIRPTLNNVRNGSFPISRNLNLITTGEPRGAVKTFIEFLLSTEGQSIVERMGYIPVR